MKLSATEVKLTFVRSRYLMGGYSLTRRDADLEKAFIREALDYERRSKRIIGTDRFGSYSIERIIFVLGTGIA